MADVRAQNALSEIQEFTSFLRVLGSYPMDMTPWNSAPSASSSSSPNNNNSKKNNDTSSSNNSKPSSSSSPSS